MPLELYSASSNLGDNLSLTPIMWVIPSRVHMVDDDCCRCIAPIFDGLGEVVFDNAKPPQASPEHPYVPGPISRKLIAGQGLNPTHVIPRIKLTDVEIVAAHARLEALLGDRLSHACVLKCNPAHLNYRTPPQDLMTRLVAQNPGTAFVNFGLSPKHAKHNAAHLNVPGVIEVLDLPVREQAACFHVIGRYLGPDTGDYHLMLAVGGRCDVLVPHSCWEYDYRRFHYTPDCWLNEAEPRVAYWNWNYPFNGPSVTGLLLAEPKDPGKSYDELSIALVKATKNPANRGAQERFETMCVELAEQYGFGLHNRIVVSPEFAALRDVNDQLYDHTGRTADPTRQPQAEDQQVTNRLNYARYQGKGALQERFFGTVLSEQKFGVAVESKGCT